MILRKGMAGGGVDGLVTTMRLTLLLFQAIIMPERICTMSEASPASPAAWSLLRTIRSVSLAHST